MYSTVLNVRFTRWRQSAITVAAGFWVTAWKTPRESFSVARVVQSKAVSPVLRIMPSVRGIRRSREAIEREPSLNPVSEGSRRAVKIFLCGCWLAPRFIFRLDGLVFLEA
jgi:hypothetical protein